MLAPLDKSTDLDHLIQVTKATGDPLRAGILQALGAESYAVLELGVIFDMAQPAMSHHLRILAEAGLVSKRKEGTSIFYQRASTSDQPLNRAIFDEIDATTIPTAVQKRITGVYKSRQKHTRKYFATRTDALSNQQELISTPSVYSTAVLETAALVADPEQATAIEIGPGGGELLTALGPIFKKVLGIDNSAEMLAKARQKTQGFDNVTLLEHDLSDLKTNTKYDLALATMVLHHQPSPGQFFTNLSGRLKPRGLLVLAELCPHGHEWVKDLCGDLWLGFSIEQLKSWAENAGFALHQHQFLAQKNGFTVQVVSFKSAPN